MKSCVYCTQPIEDDSIVCRYCSRQVPKDAVTLQHPGHRFGLGTTETAYAIWDLTSSTPPIATFPLTAEGWDDARFRYGQLEAEAEEAPGGEHELEPVTTTSAPIYPRFHTDEAELGSGRPFTIAAWICAGLAVLLAPSLLGIQIVFGPAGIVLGAMGHSRGDPQGQRALWASAVGMVLGIVIVFALCADGSCR